MDKMEHKYPEVHKFTLRTHGDAVAFMLHLVHFAAIIIIIKEDNNHRGGRRFKGRHFGPQISSKSLSRFISSK